MIKEWSTLALIVIGVVIALALSGSVSTATPVSQTTAAVVTDSAHVITGLDLHDPMVLKSESTYYLYGTQYACGFRWSWATPTDFCGFGVSTAPSLDGPWSPITTLFSPDNIDPWNGRTWRDQCTRRNNAGCFNPRMVQRASDGVWILSFNSPADYSDTKSNGYNFMGCAGPTGPCGPGEVNGSYNKPKMSICYGNGDFGIFVDGSTAYIICTALGESGISVEQLDRWWTNGNGIGAHDIVGYDRVEGPGAYFDAPSGKWVATLNYDNCGYGSGCGLAYATAPSPIGPWTAPGNWGFAVDPKARAVLSFNSCGGQPRTVSTVDGVPYQIIDLWVPGAAGDSRNQTDAGIVITPLVFRNPANTPGVPWQPFDELKCGV